LCLFSARVSAGPVKGVAEAMEAARTKAGRRIIEGKEGRKELRGSCRWEREGRPSRLRA